MSESAESVIDALADAALDRRLSWQQVDASLGLLQLGAALALQEPLEPAQEAWQRRARLRAQDLLARIHSREERRFWAAFAEQRLADPGLRPRKEWERQPKPRWWAGATPQDVLEFDLYPGGPDGSDLASLSHEELRRRLAVAASRLEAGRTHSSWLSRYSRQLLQERRSREGAA